MRIRYRTSTAGFVWERKGHDYGVCSAPTLRIPDGRVLFAVSPGEREMVSREQLTRAAKQFLAKVEADFDLLQYAYSYRGKDLSGRGYGISGKLADGTLFVLHAGPGVCLLEEREWEPGDPSVRVVRTVDARCLNTIETQSFGTITIQRRKRRLTIHHQLMDLIAFLDQQTDEMVEKSLDEGKQTPMDLVRGLEAAEGLEEDWFQERLLEFGDAGLFELIDWYGKPSCRKYRHTLAYIFKNWYSQVAVQARLNEKLAAGTQPQRQRLYHDLFDTLPS